MPERGVREAIAMARRIGKGARGPGPIRWSSARREVPGTYSMIRKGRPAPMPQSWSSRHERGQAAHQARFAFESGDCPEECA